MPHQHRKVPHDEALPRIKHFKHAKKPEVAWTKFDPADLARICSQPGVTGVKFFYSTKNAGGKDDIPNIIMQVIKGNPLIAGGLTFEYYEGTDSGICPPPQGSCDMTIEMP